MQSHDLDICKIGSDKKVLKQFQQNQKIFFSIKVIKINHVDKRQQRIIVLTNKNLYNIVPEGFLPTIQRIRRKICYKNISSLTISRYSPEFIVHVQKEHDYRFWSINAKIKIAQTLIKLYCAYNSKLMAVRFYDDMTLKKYSTTIVDLSKKHKKLHNTPPLYLNADNMKQMMEAKPESKLIFHKEGEQLTLESFQIVKVLGRGAFGKVMLCKNSKTNKYYAIKSMRKQNLIEAARFEKVKSQRQLLSKVDHPFLVSLQYAFQTKQKVFLVMNFVKGGQLFNQISKGKQLTQNRAKFYAAQIVLALSYLHEIGYVYRDLKPENILIEDDGYLKISDYGLAKYIKEKERTYSLAGTPVYVSPQVIIGKGQTYTSDWWALGILIYEMICGYPPFYNNNQKKLMDEILVKQVTFSSKRNEISPQCKNLIIRLLKKDASHRLGSQGSSQIKKHPWFEQVNWEKIINKQYTPEFIPKVLSEQDVGNFDSKFTKQLPVDSLIASDYILLKKIQDQFTNFQFSKDESYDENCAKTYDSTFFSKD